MSEPDYNVFTDGCCFRHPTEGLISSYSVITDDGQQTRQFRIQETERIGGKQSAQRAELIAVIRALERAQGLRVNVFTDSAYVVGAIFTEMPLWRRNGYRTAAGTLIKHSVEIERLGEALLKPKEVAIVKCRAHTGGTSYVEVGNDRADRVVFMDVKPGHRYEMCYGRLSGSVPLGKLDIETQCRDNRFVVCGGGAPVKNGTYNIRGGWWLCGNDAYMVLPPDWTGVCTPIFVTDHTFFITHANQTSRLRRDAPTFSPHDSVWGTDVPEEFKHWSKGEKFGLALFPWAGVAKNMLRIETIDYRLKSFVNFSIGVEEGQNRELEAIRLMVLQNRMVLDLQTAATGGVCALFNKTCCTFIPDEVHTSVAEGMSNLYALREALLKLLFPVVVGLVIVCVVSSCIVPCVRRMLSSMILNQVQADRQMPLLSPSLGGRDRSVVPLFAGVDTQTIL
uniref:RNase H type-1 domain-containing protein n=1 Tax=Hippocampus comes TaxID=109280 RepID=A0A3Q2Z0G8_HIPCM